MIQDISDALNMTLTNTELASANHLLYAYRGDGDKCEQNFDSVGDCGVRLHMLDYMIDNSIDSTILIVARHCTSDFKYIGKRRMENTVKVCEKAHIHLLYNMPWIANVHDLP